MSFHVERALVVAWAVAVAVAALLRTPRVRRGDGRPPLDGQR